VIHEEDRADLGGALTTGTSSAAVPRGSKNTRLKKKHHHFVVMFSQEMAEEQSTSCALSQGMAACIADLVQRGHGSFAPVEQRRETIRVHVLSMLPGATVVALANQREGFTTAVDAAEWMKKFFKTHKKSVSHLELVASGAGPGLVLHMLMTAGGDGDPQFQSSEVPVAQAQSLGFLGADDKGRLITMSLRGKPNVANIRKLCIHLQSFMPAFELQISSDTESTPMRLSADKRETQEELNDFASEQNFLYEVIQTHLFL
jgi:hypothetical protein